MKSQIPEDPRFDDAMRALHHAAGVSVSATTRAGLKTARHAPSESLFASRLDSRWPWLGAGLASLVLLVAVGVQPGVQPGPQAGPEPTQAASRLAAAGDVDQFDSGYPSALAALDEDPDLYVWLASDSGPLTLEQY